MKKYSKTTKSKIVKEVLPQYSSFKRITFDSNIMAGQACIRGMRIPASLIVNLIAHGKTNKDIIEEYPDIEAEDISEALQYAAWLLKDEVHFVH